MMNEILNKSFTYTGATLEQLLQQKLGKPGLNKTQFEKLAGIERKSLDSILNPNKKKTSEIF